MNTKDVWVFMRNENTYQPQGQRCAKIMSIHFCEMQNRELRLCYLVWYPRGEMDYIPVSECQNEKIYLIGTYNRVCGFDAIAEAESRDDR
jgi:hypothetical protein